MKFLIVLRECMHFHLFRFDCLERSLSSPVTVPVGVVAVRPQINALSMKCRRCFANMRTSLLIALYCKA